MSGRAGIVNHHGNPPPIDAGELLRIRDAMITRSRRRRVPDPLVLDMALGRRIQIEINRDDYETPDGT